MALNGRDHLTALPPEVLTKILAEVPLSSFFNLTHTSSGLRQFMKANTAQICNTAIRARFPIEAEVFKLVLKDGWLIITNERLLDLEQNHRFNGPWAIQRQVGKLVRARFTGIAASEQESFMYSTFQLAVEDPGPITLFILEQHWGKENTSPTSSDDDGLIMSEFLWELDPGFRVCPERDDSLLKEGLRLREMAWSYDIHEVEA